jgi:FMN phosphatase YigB (HAD superfamily)
VTSLTTIAFDADDTLWHNERFFRLTQERLATLLADHTDAQTLHARLLAAERRNLGHYGFGIKGFVLSMIETAIEVTDERVPARVIRELIEAGQEMLRHPIELLPRRATSSTRNASSPSPASAISSTASRSFRTRPPRPMPRFSPVTAKARSAR